MRDSRGSTNTQDAAVFELPTQNSLVKGFYPAQCREDNTQDAATMSNLEAGTILCLSLNLALSLLADLKSPVLTYVCVFDLP